MKQEGFTFSAEICILIEELQTETKKDFAKRKAGPERRKMRIGYVSSMGKRI